MFLFVSLDTGGVAAVASPVNPATDPAIMAAIHHGTLDVFKLSRNTIVQLGFDGEWSPVDRSTIPAFLAALPKPVMAKLPHEAKEVA